MASCALLDEHGLRFEARGQHCTEAAQRALEKYATDMATAQAEVERDDADFLRSLGGQNAAE